MTRHITTHHTLKLFVVVMSRWRVAQANESNGPKFIQPLCEVQGHLSHLSAFYNIIFKRLSATAQPVEAHLVSDPYRRMDSTKRIISLLCGQ